MKYVISAVVIVLVLGAGTYYFYSQNEPAQMNQDKSMVEPDGMMNKDESPEKMDGSDSAAMNGSSMDKGDVMMMQDHGQYLPFAQNVLEQTAGKKRVLFFYANWCPICRPADADFTSNVSKFPADLVLIRVNYNDDQTDADEKALAQKYGITYQHTFVLIDENGKEIKKWNGGQTDKLLSEVK